jgi:hypothetical protein
MFLPLLALESAELPIAGEKLREGQEKTSKALQVTRLNRVQNEKQQKDSKSG